MKRLRKVLMLLDWEELHDLLRLVLDEIKVRKERIDVPRNLQKNLGVTTETDSVGD